MILNEEETPVLLMMGRAANVVAVTLATPLDDVDYLMLNSGQDALMMIPTLLEDTLCLAKLTLPTTTDSLIGKTVIISAEDLQTQALPTLQDRLNERGHEVVAALIQEARERGELISRSEIYQIMAGQPPTLPHVVAEMAALLPRLLALAETAVVYNQGLVFRYQSPQAPRPLQFPSVIRAQSGPVLVANIFALLFIAIALWDGTFVLGRARSIPQLLLVHIRLFLGFSLPLWIAQLMLWLYSKRYGIQIAFISAWQAQHLEPEQLHRLVLRLRPKTFTLMALYQPIRPPSPIPQPTRIYFFLFLFGLIGLFWLMPFMPLYDWLAQLYVAYWVSSLLFWLSHWIARHES